MMRPLEPLTPRTVLDAIANARALRTYRSGTLDYDDHLSAFDAVTTQLERALSRPGSSPPLIPCQPKLQQSRSCSEGLRRPWTVPAHVGVIAGAPLRRRARHRARRRAR